MSATVVSLLPLDVKCRKPVHPGWFSLPAPEAGKFSQLHIPEAWKFVYMHEGRYIRVPVSTLEVAGAICRDYIMNSIARTDEAYPGLFSVPGEHSDEELLIEYPTEFQQAKEAQDLWFLRLVEIADVDWERTGERRAIADIQKIAARELGFSDREWLITIPGRVNSCPACKTQVIPGAIICATCRAVLDPEAYSEMQFAIESA